MGPHVQFWANTELVYVQDCSKDNYSGLYTRSIVYLDTRLCRCGIIELRNLLEIRPIGLRHMQSNTMMYNEVEAMVTDGTLRGRVAS